MKWVFLGLALLWAGEASAQTTLLPPLYGLVQTLTCTSSSGALNFPTWPAPQGQVEITPLNSGQAFVYVCPLGGTCSSTTGKPLGVAQGWTFASAPTTKPTCITDGAASANIFTRE